MLKNIIYNKIKQYTMNEEDINKEKEKLIDEFK